MNVAARLEALAKPGGICVSRVVRDQVRDKLGFSFTAVGQGWLIFDLPEADMGCHPTDGEKDVKSGTPDISFYCDDIHKTVAELKSRGVEFVGDVKDQGYGLVTQFKMPGDLIVDLYQPSYNRNPARRA